MLLHQTPFRVKIGRKYGLVSVNRPLMSMIALRNAFLCIQVGPNGAGKSTLMKAIAGGNLAGFPTHLITVYVECEIIGEKVRAHPLKAYQFGSNTYMHAIAIG